MYLDLKTGGDAFLLDDPPLSPLSPLSPGAAERGAKHGGAEPRTPKQRRWPLRSPPALDSIPEEIPAVREVRSRLSRVRTLLDVTNLLTLILGIVLIARGDQPFQRVSMRVVGGVMISLSLLSIVAAVLVSLSLCGLFMGCVQSSAAGADADPPAEPAAAPRTSSIVSRVSREPAQPLFGWPGRSEAAAQSARYEVEVRVVEPQEGPATAGAAGAAASL